MPTGRDAPGTSRECHETGMDHQAPLPGQPRPERWFHSSAGLLTGGSGLDAAFPWRGATVAWCILLAAYSCGGSSGSGQAMPRRIPFQFLSETDKAQVAGAACGWQEAIAPSLRNAAELWPRRVDGGRAQANINSYGSPAVCEFRHGCAGSHHQGSSLRAGGAACGASAIRAAAGPRRCRGRDRVPRSCRADPACHRQSRRPRSRDRARQCHDPWRHAPADAGGGGAGPR